MLQLIHKIKNMAEKIGITFNLKPNIAVTVSLTRGAYDLLEQIKPSGLLSTPKQATLGEDHNMQLLIEKSLVEKVKGAKNTFYQLTTFGKKLVNY